MGSNYFYKYYWSSWKSDILPRPVIQKRDMYFFPINPFDSDRLYHSMPTHIFVLGVGVAIWGCMFIFEGTHISELFFLVKYSGLSGHEI